MVLPRADKKIKLGGVTYGISVLLKNDMIHIRAKKNVIMVSCLTYTLNG